MLGFSEREQQNIFRILAGILHLGNIKIEPGFSNKIHSEFLISSIPYFPRIWSIRLRDQHDSSR